MSNNKKHNKHAPTAATGYGEGVTERRLEPTVHNEPTEKPVPTAPAAEKISDAIETKTEEIKEMNAEIASVSAELARKTASQESVSLKTDAEIVQPKGPASLMVPVAIIVAGALIAGSILYNGSRTPAVPKDAAYLNVAAQLKKGTISEEVGLNKKTFAKCLESGKYTAPIKVISDAGVKAGIQGTPFSVMITASGKKFVINGALPTENVKAMIESALKGDVTDAVEIDIPPVTAKDHLTGNPNAEIKIVEYSDTECPFSKRFHQTMIDIMKEQGTNGKVAWVYRSFPLDGLHQKARYEAEAVECAFEQGGNAKYWEYLDLLFKVTPSNDGLDSALL
jgi:protein-disulfide isomerase